MEEYISKFIKGSPTINFYLIKSSNNEEDYTWSNNIWDGYKKYCELHKVYKQNP